MKNVTTILGDEVCVNDFKYFVTMTDKDMSGWGLAKGKTLKRVILCKNADDAYNLVDRIKARKNTGMTYVNVKRVFPNYSSRYVVMYDNKPNSLFNY